MIEGVAEQEDLIRNYCLHCGYELLDLYREKMVSEQRCLQPIFKNLLTDLVVSDVQRIVVASDKVFPVNNCVRESLFIFLASKEIEVHICTRGQVAVDGGFLSSEKRINIQKEFSRFDQSIEQVKRLASRKIYRNRYGKCEGRKSYEEVAPELLKEIRRLRRRRKGLKLRTWKMIAAELNKAGKTTLSGKKFTGNNIATIMHRRKLLGQTSKNVGRGKDG